MVLLQTFLTLEYEFDYLVAVVTLLLLPTGQESRWPLHPVWPWSGRSVYTKVIHLIHSPPFQWVYSAR